MRIRNQLALSLAALIALSMNSCGSRLQFIKKQNKGTGGDRVDLAALKFTDITTGEEITAKKFMDDNNVHFLLMTFGSVGCSACNAEAKDFSLNFEGKHELMLNKKEKQFDFIGVNTDSGAAQNKFKAIMLNDEERKAYGYNFIKWADPKGEIVTTHLMEPDRQFGIPFTIFIKDSEIKWRIYNDEHADMESILARADATIKGEEYTKKPTPTPTPVVVDTDLKNYMLSMQRPDRFQFVDVKNCKGETVSLGSVAKQDSLKYFTVAKEACEAGSACALMAKGVEQGLGACENCQQVILKTSGDVTKAECDLHQEKIYSGGAEFFSKFASHFDWRLPKYRPSKKPSGTPDKVPDVKGPFALGFSTDGRLIFSWEDGAGIPGTVADNAKASTQSKTLVDNSLPDFSLYGKGFKDGQIGYKTFRDIVKQSKYTFLAVFGSGCGSCVDEASEWSKPGGVYEFCAQRPDFCQAYAMDMFHHSFYAGFDVKSDAELYNHIISTQYHAKNGDYQRDVKFPLIVGTELLPDDEYARLGEGYFTPTLGWQTGIGQIIYDREGKIVKSFILAEMTIDNALVKTLKFLYEHQ